MAFLLWIIHEFSHPVIYLLIIWRVTLHFSYPLCNLKLEVTGQKNVACLLISKLPKFESCLSDCCCCCILCIMGVISLLWHHHLEKYNWRLCLFQISIYPFCIDWKLGKGNFIPNLIYIVNSNTTNSYNLEINCKFAINSY